MGKTTKKDIFKDRETYIKIEAKTGGRCSESMFRKYLVKICGISLLMAGLISGCSIEQTNETKVSDLTYTIVEESETPEELKTMIEERKRRILNLPMRWRMICISCGDMGSRRREDTVSV